MSGRGSSIEALVPPPSSSLSLPTVSSIVEVGRRSQPHKRASRTAVFGSALTKVVAGPLCVVFAVMAIVVDAGFSHVGAGFWAGGIALTAGVLGLLASRRARFPPSRSPGYMIAYMSLSVLSFAASTLLIIFAGTGLGHDAADPPPRIAPEPWRRYPAIAANAVLIALSTLDCLASIVAIGAGLRELCRCPWSNPEKKVRKVRLMQWLGAHRYILYPEREIAPFKPLPHPAVYDLGPAPYSPSPPFNKSPLPPPPPLKDLNRSIVWKQPPTDLGHFCTRQYKHHDRRPTPSEYYNGRR